MSAPVLLVNTNVARPPVSPVGLEYVTHALIHAGIAVEVLDLAFENDWKASLRRVLHHTEPLMVGVSLRNTDDCSFRSKKSFLPWISEVVTEINILSAVPVFLGGVGFSTMPEASLTSVPAKAGIVGDGEESIVALARCVSRGGTWSDIPNLVYWRDGEVVRNPRKYADLKSMPLPLRRVFDNRRYENLGAMVGIETKRGCSQECIYCADPVAKGRRIRVRAPSVVVEEIRDLLDQGVTWLHVCDSEFNLPLEHAGDVCRSIIDSGLGERIRWYCYCSPVPFDAELGRLMRSAGCAGINFGVDSLCDDQLSRLHRAYSARDVLQTVDVLKREGLNYMFDLLVGGPGESPESIRRTIEQVRQTEIPLVGIAAGVRVYPDTLLERSMAEGSIAGRLLKDDGQAHGQPVYYLSADLGDDLFDFVNELVAGDTRFLQLSAPSDEGSYNYADDDTLSRLIEQGARGAYWDILRHHING